MSLFRLLSKPATENLLEADIRRITDIDKIIKTLYPF